MMVSKNFNNNPPPSPPQNSYQLPNQYFVPTYYDNQYISNQIAPENNTPNNYSYESSLTTRKTVPKIPNRGSTKKKKRSTLVYTMTPDRAEKSRCQICSKQFSRPSSLQTHYYSHTGERLFKCPWDGCGKVFSVKLNMKRHYRLHERDHKAKESKENNEKQENETLQPSIAPPPAMPVLSKPLSTFTDLSQNLMLGYDSYSLSNMNISRSQPSLNTGDTKLMNENNSFLLPAPIPELLQPQVNHPMPILSNHQYNQFSNYETLQPNTHGYPIVDNPYNTDKASKYGMSRPQLSNNSYYSNNSSYNEATPIQVGSSYSTTQGPAPATFDPNTNFNYITSDYKFMPNQNTSYNNNNFPESP